MKKQILLLIIGALVIFVVAGVLGIYYQQQRMTSQILVQQESAQKMQAVVKALSSNMVNSLSVYGQVTNINGQDLILTFAGDIIAVHIKDNAPISSFASASAGGVASQPQVKFSDIKNGNSLTIELKVLPDGQLEGQSIIVAPVFNAATSGNNK